MDTLLRDIRFGLRTLLRDKGFAATIVLTLLVCIAANSVIFAIVYSVVLQPLPVPEANAILMMSNRYPKAGVAELDESSTGDYFDRRENLTAFEEQAMFTTRGRTVEIAGVAERITTMDTTTTLFPLLRVSPAIGRAFTPEDGEPGHEKKIILSHGLWQQMFGGDAAAVGRDLRINGEPYTVIGVMAAGFNFVDPEVRLWLPLAFNEQDRQRYHSNNYYNIGRLKPGATLQQAQSQVDALNAANLERFPKWKEALVNAGYHTKVEPLQDLLIRDVRGALYLLWGGAAFVLLIGGLNIANVALARFTLRRKELVTRLALGAGRWQLVRQVMVENVMLSLAGGGAGLAVAYGVLRLLATYGLDRFPRAGEVHLGWEVCAVALALAIVAGVPIGLAPLRDTRRMQLSSALQEESRSGTGGRRSRLARQSLVAAQVAIAFVLLVGSGLLLVSFSNLLKVDPGYRTEGILTMSTNLGPARYRDDSLVRQVVQRALDAIRALPGVESAAGSLSLPFGGQYADSVIVAEGYEMKPGESLISPRLMIVTPGYFETLGIGLVHGRYFDDTDTAEAPRAVIVDERLAEHFWPGRDPVGRRLFQPEGPDDLTPNEKTKWLYVVGVVKDVRLERLDGTGTPVGTYYYAQTQVPTRGIAFVIRTRTPEGIAGAARAEIAKVDPELPVFNVRTMEERVQLSLASRRTSLTLAMAFGGLALFLSAVGTYGVLAYLISQRRREIGIRMALGSTQGGIVKLVLREGVALLATGLAIGIAGAVAMRGVIAGETYGVGALDPMVLAGVAGLLAAVTVAACLIPARRASQVDPVIVLSEQ